MKLPVKLVYWLLILIFSLLVLAFFGYPDSRLKIIACDVGQADSILITYGKFQLLTDGGLPDNKAEKCLNRHIPFWDRELEVVVLTHPEVDHFGGLPEILDNYKVDYFIAGSLKSSAPEYQVLVKAVGSEGARVITPITGTAIRYGKLYYDIFWPSEAFLVENGYDGNRGKLASFSANGETNDYSVQALVSFEKFRGILTGDAGTVVGTKIGPYINFKNVNYIKIPHHGSNNSLTSYYISLFEPEIAVISVGKDNSYGHPTGEILEILSKKGLNIKRTDLSGDITVETDGEKILLK